jgi:acyl-CoA synthetase (AMP-forming)/AMP-acid ligase II
MAPTPLAAAGALAGAAYLNARWSLAHDVLYFRIIGSTLVRLFLASRADKLNAFYVLEQHARNRATAGKPFILFEGRPFTYAETYDTVLRYGAWLRERCGVRHGEIVALDYQNSETFVFLWFAIWAAGAKPAFTNYHLQGAALAHCLRASTAKLVVVDPRVAGAVTEEVRREVPGMTFVVFTPNVEAEATRQDPVRYQDAVRSESDKFNMAVLIYTSGTTGMPKPAIVSWAKVYLGSNMASKGTGSGPSDIIYTVCPSACPMLMRTGWCLIIVYSACPFTTAPGPFWESAARCSSAQLLP